MLCRLDGKQYKRCVQTTLSIVNRVHRGSVTRYSARAMNKHLFEKEHRNDPRAGGLRKKVEQVISRHPSCRAA